MNKLEEIQQDDNLSPYEKFEKLTKAVLKVDKKTLDKNLAKQKAEKKTVKKAKIKKKTKK